MSGDSRRTLCVPRAAGWQAGGRSRGIKGAPAPLQTGFHYGLRGQCSPCGWAVRGVRESEQLGLSVDVSEQCCITVLAALGTRVHTCPQAGRRLPAKAPGSW